MRVLIAAAAALSIGVATSAMADGHGSTKDHYAAPYNWSGIYFGGHVGGVWGDIDFRHNEVRCGGDENLGDLRDCRESLFLREYFEDYSTSDTAFGGGFQLGVQRQFGSMVFGAEVSYTLFNAEGSDSREADRLIAGIPVEGSPLGTTPTNREFPAVTRSAEFENLLTIGGRLGYTQGRLLTYIKGGWAQSKVKFANIIDDNVVGSSSSNEQGFFLGLGLEYAVQDNITIGLDYTYARIDVGDQQQAFRDLCLRRNTGGQRFCEAHNEDVDANLHQVMLRVNYKFDPHKSHPASMK